jgi:hypothetical protein
VFTKPIQVEKGVDAELQKLFDNVDNAGRHLNVFARDVFLDAMQPGVSFIYVDMPPAVERADGAPATIADEQQAGIRPYLKNIPLENLIGWKSEMIAGVETLTQIRIKECTSEPDPENPYDNVDIDQIRVVSRVDGIGPAPGKRSARMAPTTKRNGCSTPAARSASRKSNCSRSTPTAPIS